MDYNIFIKINYYWFDDFLMTYTIYFSSKSLCFNDSIYIILSKYSVIGIWIISFLTHETKFSKYYVYPKDS